VALHRLAQLVATVLPLVLALVGMLLSGVALADPCPSSGSGGC
jgi:hypothetical protein